ncbi:MAG: protein adenylyltransferase SelO family protein, partial [Bacteroidota bacterium]
EDRELAKYLMGLLVNQQVDYTNFFTALRRSDALIDQLKEEASFEAWYVKWEAARNRGAALSESDALMAQNNPVVIPRNHLVEEALNAFVSGDTQPFHSLLDELASPYDDAFSPQLVPAGFDAGYQTFCGT